MESNDGLRFGPLGAEAVHLCVDMQRLFEEGTPWHTPWLRRVLPQVEAVARYRPQATLFTRFLPPRRPEEAQGSWRRYFEKWRDLTQERIDPGLLDLVPSLARLCPPARVLDKYGYSPFAGTFLDAELRRQGTTTLIVSGTETDVCVLAAVLDAVDLGYRVIVARDALCSSSDETHDGLMALYHRRFSQQVETADVADILAAWS